MADTKMVQCLKETRPDSHGHKYSCVSRLDSYSVLDAFDGAVVGERIMLELCEMSEQELSTLPDFEGW